MKIGVKEVRIGNLVNCGTPDAPTYKPVDIDDLEYLSKYENHFLYKIPLSEAWLKILGFEKNNLEWSQKISSLIVPADSFTVYQVAIKKFHFSISTHMQIDLLYVHQLQNLFFALTGEELYYSSYPDRFL